MTTMPQGAWDLARRAADKLVGRSADQSVVKGVLAQWVAEHGVQWPFSRNNPGNLARGWAIHFPYPYEVRFPNPQPSNPIVTFASQAGGADCYSAGLVAFDRYNLAVAKARAGDGLGFAVEVCRAGYGTRETTVRSVYAGLAGSTLPPAGPALSGGNVMIRYSGVTAVRSRMALRQGQALYSSPGGSKVTAMAKAGTVPHIGLAGQVNGHAWRAVQVGTARPYGDGHLRATILYVPASAGEVIQS